MLEEQLQLVIDQLSRIADALEGGAFVVETEEDTVVIDMSDDAVPAAPQPEPKPETPEPEAEEEKPAVNYLDMDLNTLKTMCEKRGIPIQPRQRVTTLAKFLEASDQIEAAKAKAAVCEAETTALDEKVEADPFGVEEADLFGEPPEVTREQVTAKLQEVLAANGKACVIDILKGSGVLKVKDIPESKLGNVYKAAQDTLN